MSKTNNNLNSKPSEKIHFNGVNILLAEDNIVNQMIAEETLKTFGCIVAVANNGEEAVAKLQDSDFDLVLMDCLMPVMDGYQATAEIRKLELETDRQTILVIAYTANTSTADVEKCFSAGMDDYLAKPLVNDDLQQMLVKWLPHKQSQSINDLVFSSYDETGSAITIFNKEAFYSLKKIFGVKFPDAVSRYTQSIRDNVQSINDAVVKNDLESLERYTHTLKGLSAQFGAIELSTLSKTLEGLARDGEIVQVKNKLDELSKVHEKIEELINNTMNSEVSEENKA